METQSANAKIVTKLMFRLLPVQIVPAAVTYPAGPTNNIGIRMVFRLAKDVQYQSIPGLNVLTIKI